MTGLPAHVKAAAGTAPWEAEAVPLCMAQSAPGERPVLVLVTAASYVLYHRLEGTLAGEPEDVAAVLEEAVAASAREVGSYPELVLVRHREVAGALAPLLADRQVEIVVGGTDAVRDAAAAFMRELGINAHWPVPCRTVSWGEWRLPQALVRELFAAAAQFHRRRPWLTVQNMQAPRAVLPSGRSWTCCIMGSAGDEYGLILYSEHEDLHAELERDEHDQLFLDLRGRMLSISYSTEEEAGEPMRREAQLHRYAVTDPDLYPVLMTVNTPGGGVSRADAEDLLALLHALPRFVDAHAREFRSEAEGRRLFSAEWVDAATGIRFEYAGQPVALPFDVELPPGVLDAAEADTILRQRAQAYNETPQEDLGGLAPASLQQLLDANWADRTGVVRLRTGIPLDRLADVRVLHNARVLLGLAVERGGLQATDRGNLKVAVVEELCRLFLLPDHQREELEMARRMTEDRAWPLHLLRLVCEVAGLLVHEGNRFQATDEARLLLREDRAGELFELLFRTWFVYFNIGYGSRWEWPELQQQLAFTMKRLLEVARDWRRPEDLLEEVVLPYAREAAMREYPFSDLMRLTLTWAVLEPLCDFGVLERQPYTDRRGPSTRYRVTALAAEFMAFEV